MIYYIVRHAQTIANAQGVYQSLNAPLSDVGRQQASALAKRLADRHFDTLVHSGSERAEETANVLLPAIHVEQIIVDPRTLEGEVGEWTGSGASTRAEVARSSGIPLWKVRPPGGESYLDIDARLQPVLADLLSGNFGGQVLLVGHGRVNGLILRALLRTPWPEFCPQRMHHTGVTELVFSPKKVEVRIADDVSHLPTELVTR